MFIRIFLPVYFVVAMMIAFWIRTAIVKRRIGASPLVLRWGDDLDGYVAKLIIVAEVIMIAHVVLVALGPTAFAYAVPLDLGVPGLEFVAVALLVGSLVWVAIGQAQMGSSWRIGVDHDNRTELISEGLFRRSRNPIFLGMRASLVGLFSAAPSVLALVGILIGEIAIQVQVRIEEQHLTKLHGKTYAEYTRRVRRWV